MVLRGRKIIKLKKKCKKQILYMIYIHRNIYFTFHSKNNSKLISNKPTNTRYLSNVHSSSYNYYRQDRIIFIVIETTNKSGNIMNVYAIRSLFFFSFRFIMLLHLLYSFFFCVETVYRRYQGKQSTTKISTNQYAVNCR